MTPADKANAYRKLAENPTFIEVLAETENTQTKVFLNPSSTAEEIQEAHSIIRALKLISVQFKSVYTAETRWWHKKGNKP